MSWFSKKDRSLPSKYEILSLLSEYIKKQEDTDTIDQLELLKLQINYNYYIIDENTLNKLIDKTNHEIEPINYFVSRGIHNNYSPGLKNLKEANKEKLYAAMLDTTEKKLNNSGSSTDGSLLGGKKRKTKRRKRRRKQTRRIR